MRAAIVLAAGSSRRFGAANKLLVRWRGRPLLHHALKAALAAPVGRVIVVTGSGRSRVAGAVRALRNGRLTLVHARNHGEGRRASLAAGLAALRPRERQCLVFLGDMPDLPRGIGERLLRRIAPSDEAARPVRRCAPGHPVLLNRPRETLARLRAGKLPFADARPVTAQRAAILDVDQPGDLGRRGR